MKKTIAVNDIALKYNLLGKREQKEADDFMDFLLSKQNTQKPSKDYRTKILSVSTLTDSD
ncbi:hypothetical protein MASR2M47_33390 [Draconibacterium sp.]